MEGSSHFNVPKIETDSVTFKPETKLPEHLEQYKKISHGLRAKMTPVMRAITELTDKAALRSAALPETQ